MNVAVVTPLCPRPARLGKPQEIWPGRSPVPLSRFGSDHWHLLLHIEQRGVLRRLHWADGPTLLNDAELWGHTDLDVLNDLIASMLARASVGQRRLSPLGSVVRSELDAHLASGGNFANFATRVTVTRLAG